MKLNQVFDEWLISELNWRAWKMIKLAWVIACFQWDDKVLWKSIEQAIYQTEFFWEQFRKFYWREKILDVEKIAHFIIKNQDKKEITKTDLRKLEYAPHARDWQTKWVNDAISQLEEFCTEKGFIFKQNKWVRNKVSFRVEDAPKHEETKEEEIKVTISVWHSNNYYENLFTRRETTFDKMHLATTCWKLYSWCLYEWDTRASPNKWDAWNRLVIMDFDNAWDDHFTISNAKELFKDYKYFIIPSRSHWLNKDWKNHDRFRLIMPLHREMDFTCDERYKCIMDWIMDEFKIRKFIDIWALRRTKCYFFTSDMHKETYWYWEWSKLVNWERYDNYVEPVYVSQVEYKWDAKNVLANFPWHEYANMPSWKSKPCKCTKHNDKNNSAWVSRSPRTWNLSLNCSLCWLIWWNK
jgi:hypothetical protein